MTFGSMIQRLTNGHKRRIFLAMRVLVLFHSQLVQRATSAVAPPVPAFLLHTTIFGSTILLRTTGYKNQILKVKRPVAALVFQLDQRAMLGVADLQTVK